jgi:uncharacterized protein YukE
MAAEMPVQVQAVEGAVVVDFPWAAASSAVATLNAAVAALGPQLDARGSMRPALVDWQGAYRDEFDAGLARITSTAHDTKEAMARMASSIVSGAESANEEQRTNNARAAEPRVPVGGGRQVPV